MLPSTVLHCRLDRSRSAYLCAAKMQRVAAHNKAILRGDAEPTGKLPEGWHSSRH